MREKRTVTSTQGMPGTVVETVTVPATATAIVTVTVTVTI